jgi:hypothetical protein
MRVTWTLRRQLPTQFFTHLADPLVYTPSMNRSAGEEHGPQKKGSAPYDVTVVIHEDRIRIIDVMDSVAAVFQRLVEVPANPPHTLKPSGKQHQL